MNQNSNKPLHVAMFPWFAFGHINPFINLSNKLSANGVRISFLSASGNIPRIRTTLVKSHNTQIIPLHIPAIEGLPEGLESTSNMTDASMPELLKLALDKMEPQIKTLLAQLKPHLVLFDFVQHWLPNLASQLGIKTVHFSVFSAISYSFVDYKFITNTNMEEKEDLSLRVPAIDEIKTPPKGNPKQSLSLKTFEAQNLMYMFKSFYGGPPVIVRNYLTQKCCDAIAFKSCSELEGPYIEQLKAQYGKPVLLAGLHLPEPPYEPLEPGLDNWLAQFPSKSVLFCSFGSESFLDDAQIRELALGLELTALPFILVLNFLEDSAAGLDRVLPVGLMERVKGRGMVHTGWVQQQQILAHQSVGCYVTHSGFGSVLEALVGDCQLVLLPLKGDQFFNCKLFGLDLRMGVEVNRRDQDGYFGKDDVLEAVRIVMVEADKEPGKSIRKNQGKWREFVMNKEIEDKYVCDLVRDLKDLAWN